MEFKLKTPCNDCPFLRTPYFYLHKERKEEIATSLMFGDMTFPCHKTVEYDEWEQEEGEYIYQGKEQHCAGALIVLIKMESLWYNFKLRLANVAKIFDPDKLNLKANTYSSMQEFIDATDKNGNS